MNKVFCIVGPTASGKSSLALSLAQNFHTEIISADSVQIYQSMDIGSAKPTQKEREAVNHHLIDITSIDEPVSVAAFRDIAFPIIDEINARNSVPIVVGGSGLYISSITNPLTFAVPSDEKIREEIRNRYLTEPHAVYEELRKTDPETAARLHINDGKRIVRALEVFYCSGVKMSEHGNDFQNKQNTDPPYDSCIIGIEMDRAVLYERINQRVDEMMENGLLEEVKSIYSQNFDRSLPAMQALGYKQLFQYFDGLVDLDTAVDNIKKETRHFAKRQTTWFKRDERIHWIRFDGRNTKELFDIAAEYYEDFRRLS